MFNDLKAVFYIGLIVFGLGVVGTLNNQAETGGLAVAGAILVLGAVLGNSLNAVREVLEKRKID